MASAYLGFADIQLIHDKLLHFVTFFVLSLLCYWILDAPRKRCINFTVVACTVLGGIGSEFAQSFLTTRQFDINDIVCNIAGSGLAIALSAWYHKRLLDRKREARYKLLRSNISSSSNQDTELQDIEAQLPVENTEGTSMNGKGTTQSHEDPVFLKEVEPEPLT